MKIHIINPSQFTPEVIALYRKHFVESSFDEADVIVTQFNEVETDRSVIVASNTTGLDHIKAPNAQVVSLRGEELSDFTAVPELCMWAILELVRHRANEELKGKTLGVLGNGRIGQALSCYAWGLRMEVIYFDRDGRFSSKEVLEESDIVSLSITAEEENRGFMDMDKFKQMKDGSWFLNSARPWLVDEEALKWALDNKLRGAWFDFEMPLEHPNLITTPHQGGSTKESQARSQMLICRKVLKYVS